MKIEGAGVEREAAGLLSSSQSRISSNGAGTRSQEMVYHAADELLLHQQQQQSESTDDQPRRRSVNLSEKGKSFYFFCFSLAVANNVACRPLPLSFVRVQITNSRRASNRHVQIDWFS